ncbi:GGDEF domain-containing protein [Xanthomonas vesicatoria]|uniref:GGDEF domain-containing protein n=1 Tax=Xanthomonas vesicatoria TaxID=56460 RepID=UPI000732262F|nr:diguanylate cyclase [Xanthomonas vesicatoria]KTF36782.1 histidine kinase [Xanthomonas vesicatoria]MCC8559113.1 diguanylate cyclase [Xanthomonas vesicatoria]MCC8602072.1 diguanylate cyclase [Xanthomonas vesicatoria]MCC8610498.1 diguanylate cyclase [Xanthomonas vesicatoria]MCC8619061.1 diguanylate cyclase [Xanthomonas vesicatoria]
MQLPDVPALHLIHAPLLPSEVGALLGARPPANEDERLAALHAHQLLDTAAEPQYDALVSDAAALCRTPMALISLVDTQRQWFKARIGMQPGETPRTLSFCAHAILAPDQLMEVTDTRLDARFVNNALVTGEPQIRFYAGAPLLTSDGIALGTLCVLDRTPRRLSGAERDALRALARQVVDTIELRRAAELVELDGLRDALTGLWNRAGLEHGLQTLQGTSAAATESSLGFLLIELDGFKRHRLQSGVATAEAMLVQAARLLEAQLPPAAIVARLGCDRLCVALPVAAASAAMRLAEDIRGAVEAARWPTGTLTVSVGLVDGPIGEMIDSNTLLARARHALQGAICDGRNRAQRFSGWHLHG